MDARETAGRCQLAEFIAIINLRRYSGDFRPSSGARSSEFGVAPHYEAPRDEYSSILRSRLYPLKTDTLTFTCRVEVVTDR